MLLESIRAVTHEPAIRFKTDVTEARQRVVNARACNGHYQMVGDVWHTMAVVISDGICVLKFVTLQNEWHIDS